MTNQRRPMSRVQRSRQRVARPAVQRQSQSKLSTVQSSGPTQTETPESPESPESAAPEMNPVLQMQQNVGNRHVSRMIQAQREGHASSASTAPSGMVQRIFGWSAAEKAEKKRNDDYQNALAVKERFEEQKYAFEDSARDKNNTFESKHPKEAQIIAEYQAEEQRRAEIDRLKSEIESQLGSGGFFAGVWSFLGGSNKDDKVAEETGGQLTPVQEQKINRLVELGDRGKAALKDLNLLLPADAAQKAQEIMALGDAKKISKAMKKYSTREQMQIATVLSRLMGGITARGDANQINPQDIQLEVFAHKIAYKGTEDPEIKNLLDQWGYEKSYRRTVEGSGIFAGLIMPKQGSNATPVMVFKGTNPKKASDIAADLDPIAVGFSTFQYHKDTIGSILGEAGQKVLVTGHSLGGALAQHCTSAFPGNVSRLVTFQAPAISSAQALAFKFAKDKPQVTHHFAVGDVVDLAGGKHLEGEFFRHDPSDGMLGGIIKADSHTKFLLMAPEYQQAREQMGLTDETLQKLGIQKYSNAEPVKRFGTHPNWFKRILVETVRTAASPLGVIPWVIGFFQQNTVKLGDDTIQNNAYALAKKKFEDYKKKAEKPGWFSAAPGVKTSEVMKIIEDIIQSDPNYATNAGAEGIAHAAYDVLHYHVVIENGAITEFRKL